MAELTAVATLEFDPALYPRIGISEYHVGEIAKAMEGGHESPRSSLTARPGSW